MKKLFFVFGIFLLLAGCSNVYSKVYTDYDRSVDFTKYKTFAWLPDQADTANSPYNNEIIRNNIRNYVGQCISDRGYAFNKENPDLLLQLQIINAKKQDERTTHINPFPYAYYYRPYYLGSLYHQPYRYSYYYNYPWFGYTSGFTTSTTQKMEYVKGSITLNVIDRNSKKLIWTGTAEGDIYDPSLISRDLHPAVHRIIAQYPVKPIARKDNRVA